MPQSYVLVHHRQLFTRLLLEQTNRLLNRERRVFEWAVCWFDLHFKSVAHLDCEVGRAEWMQLKARAQVIGNLMLEVYFRL